MALTTYNLVQPQGTALPADFTVLEGGFDFDGLGLVGTNSQRNVFQFADTPDGTYNYTLQNVGTDGEVGAFEFRWLNDNNRLTVAWNPQTGVVNITNNSSGQTFTPFTETTAVLGENATIDLRLVLDGSTVALYIEDEVTPSFEWDNESHIGENDKRIRLKGENIRLTALSFDPVVGGTATVSNLVIDTSNDLPASGTIQYYAHKVSDKTVFEEGTIAFTNGTATIALPIADFPVGTSVDWSIIDPANDLGANGRQDTVAV